MLIFPSSPYPPKTCIIFRIKSKKVYKLTNKANMTLKAFVNADPTAWNGLSAFPNLSSVSVRDTCSKTPSQSLSRFSSFKPS